MHPRPALDQTLIESKEKWYLDVVGLLGVVVEHLLMLLVRLSHLHAALRLHLK